MQLGHLIRIALSMPPHVALGKAVGLARRLVAERLAARRLRRCCTYLPAQVGPERRLGSLDLSVGKAALLPVLEALVPLYIGHRFDLLGSGWVRVAHGETYAGFETHRYGPSAALGLGWRDDIARSQQPGNRDRARAVLELITDPTYRPIDWHVDFKSGYRWDPACWGRSIAYGHVPGVDVKVPWELARVQHLVHLAYAGPVYAGEFRNQVLDFLGSNPPGWGVNWACPMDVAIRAVNMALAWDLFKSQGVDFDPAFEAELACGLRAHGRHVVTYLEWHDHHRANHYLADIAGLAFIAAYLPADSETDLWLAFAIQQLDAEICRQFTPDGANFEASTSYHRLSAEMALHAVALVMGLPETRREALLRFNLALWPRSGEPRPQPGPMTWPPFSEESLARLSRVADFAAAVTKPSREILQCGDNDSGRFLKLSPLFDLKGHGPAERHLDLSGLMASAKGLFALEMETPATTDVETAVVAALARGLRLPASPAPAWAAPSEAVGPGPGLRLIFIPPDPAALDGLTTSAFPQFGLFLWKGPRAFIAVHCGPIGQNGNGGHAHNDQLAVEIEIDGVPWARDPGTYVYTPDLDARNRYRSAMAHFVPRRGEAEPASFISPFRMEDRAQARVLRWGPDFVGCHQGFGERVYRRVMVEEGRILVEDWPAETAEHIIRAPGDLAALWGTPPPFSSGYGLVQP